MKVYPTSENALNISHPTGGPLKREGSEWPEDGFTARMLTDEAATLDPAKGIGAPAPVAPPRPAPSVSN